MKNRTYKVESSIDFQKDFIKLTKKNLNLQERISKTLKQLRNDPFHPGLRTHKADTKEYGYRFSSRVTGDLRIIWDLEGTQIIILLALRGHDIYK